jgi:hypothetical protein
MLSASFEVGNQVTAVGRNPGAVGPGFSGVFGAHHRWGGNKLPREACLHQHETLATDIRKEKAGEIEAGEVVPPRTHPRLR